MADPLDMRAAVAEYVTALHRSYLAQADTFPPAVRGRMPLLAGGTITVAAIGARNLHLLATRENLGPLRGQEVSVSGSLPGLEWSLRFYDPVVVPALGLIDEREAPAYAEVKHALGLSTVVYHVVAQPGSGLTPHHAGHVGSGLAANDSAAARDFETIRSRVRGRESLVDELVGAASAGLPRAQALLAKAIAPHNTAIDALMAQPNPDPDEIRKVLLESVGGRRDWAPTSPDERHSRPIGSDESATRSDGGGGAPRE